MQQRQVFSRRGPHNKKALKRMVLSTHYILYDMVRDILTANASLVLQENDMISKMEKISERYYQIPSNKMNKYQENILEVSFSISRNPDTFFSKRSIFFKHLQCI